MLSLFILSVPPKIDANNASDYGLSVVAGQTAEIVCAVTGIPEPTIAWYKDGFEIDLIDMPEIHLFDDGKRLEIISTEVTDAATYRCRAKNEAGSATRDFQLHVLGKLKQFIS